MGLFLEDSILTLFHRFRELKQTGTFGHCEIFIFFLENGKILVAKGEGS
jgi:hypothetical protein